MLFLMNDVVFSLDGVVRDAQMGGTQVKKLSLPSIITMGQELYAAEPLLQHTHPDRALRLAALISAKAPMINAALFVAPTLDCPPAEVTARFVSAEFEVMADLYNMHRDGLLNTIKADRVIWRRLAA